LHVRFKKNNPGLITNYFALSPTYSDTSCTIASESMSAITVRSEFSVSGPRGKPRLFVFTKLYRISAKLSTRVYY